MIFRGDRLDEQRRTEARPWLVQQLLGQWPLLAAVVAAVVAIPFNAGPNAIEMALVSVAVGLLLPLFGLLEGRASDEVAHTVPGFVFIALVVALRHFEGESMAGFGALLIVPVLWLATLGSRREVLVMSVGVAAALVFPILLAGGPEYPVEEWRRAIIVTALAIAGGVSIQRLICQLRSTRDELTRQSVRVAASERRLKDIVVHCYAAFVSTNDTGAVTEWNPRAEAIFGYVRSEAIGRQITDLIVPPRHRVTVLRGLESYVRTGRGPLLGRLVEVSGLHRAGHELPVEAMVSVCDIDDEITFNAFAYDITDRKRAEKEREALLVREQRLRAQAEVARERLRALVDLGTSVAESLDHTHVLNAIVRHSIASLADWAVVYLAGEGDGLIHAEAWGHNDPSCEDTLSTLGEQYPIRVIDPHPVAVAMRTGQSQVTSEVRETTLMRLARDAEQLALLNALGIGSTMFVPLIARNRTIGVIALVRTTHSRPYDEDDCGFAESLAREAGLGVDNARLYEQAEYRGRVARVLNYITDGVALVGPRGRVQFWNASAERITGRTATDVVGRQPGEVFPGWNDWVERIPISTAPSPITDRSETLPLKIGGRELWLASAAVQYGQTKVLMFRNVTEERSIEELTTDFVATVSHELRTPLTTVRGAAITLQRQDIELSDETRSHLLTVLEQETEHLDRIIDEILLAGKLGGDRLVVLQEDFDPCDLMYDAIEAIEPRVPDGITLHGECDPELPPVSGDSGRVRQVMLNLIDNAIKYSPDGGDIVTTVERHGSFVRFSIRDSGMGIPYAEQRRIFKKFYRSDAGMSRGVGGTGLGLYICRELVRRMGGRIWVVSRERQGSTFHVELPVSEKVHRQCDRTVADSERNDANQA